MVGDWNTFNQTGSSPLTQTRTHGPAHEFTSFTGTNSGTLTYDAKGNQTVRPASLVAPALNLRWDFDNRLKGADTDGTPASLEVTYEFDALGRRVARNGPSGNVVFVQSGQRTIADYARGAVASSPSFRYVYGSYIDEPILRHGGTSSTLPTSGTNLAYYHRNQQYSIVALTNHSGAILERYAYTAHGELTIMAANAAVRATSLYNNRYTYTGREHDPDLNLYHFRARLYDPVAGRFVSRDPLGFVDGMSLYRAYFAPNSKDAMGLSMTKEECNKAAKEALDSDEIKPLVENLISRNCPRNLSSIICEDCKENEGLQPYKTGGFFDSNTKKIRICLNSNSGVDRVKNILKHELIHAFDDCGIKQHKDPWARCYWHTCSEIRAYSVDGGCADDGYDRKKNETKKDCIKRRAKRSIVKAGCLIYTKEPRYDLYYEHCHICDICCKNSIPLDMPLESDMPKL